MQKNADHLREAHPEGDREALDVVEPEQPLPRECIGTDLASQNYAVVSRIQNSKDSASGSNYNSRKFLAPPEANPDFLLNNIKQH